MDDVRYAEIPCREQSRKIRFPGLRDDDVDGTPPSDSNRSNERSERPFDESGPRIDRILKRTFRFGVPVEKINVVSSLSKS
ncbi:hypothetical protein NGM29_06925 [Natronosalvus rutilus]|uniref:Uncharacterized protein n=1 Tax=Natronosalvus rutilus TaxID=2953753 RepID=A0A9E7NDK0_9EURY|nr:hypothetical protein [Natronosalvus rutilus]UTF54979.1 hypothetical protein NGM29_06925 [Natronosalvus rutilus]